MADWETARRCPKCSTPGKEITKFAVTRPRGGKATLHILECPMVLCVWSGERFQVQVNEDGSIPDPENPITRAANKQFRVDESPLVIQQRITAMNDAAQEILDESERQGRM